MVLKRNQKEGGQISILDEGNQASPLETFLINTSTGSAAILIKTGEVEDVTIVPSRQVSLSVASSASHSSIGSTVTVASRDTNSSGKVSKDRTSSTSSVPQLSTLRNQ